MNIDAGLLPLMEKKVCPHVFMMFSIQQTILIELHFVLSKTLLILVPICHLFLSGTLKNRRYCQFLSCILSPHHQMPIKFRIPDLHSETYVSCSNLLFQRLSSLCTPDESLPMTKSMKNTLKLTSFTSDHETVIC